MYRIIRGCDAMGIMVRKRAERLCHMYALCLRNGVKTIPSKAQSGSGKMTRHQTVEVSGMGGGSDWMTENVKAAIFSPLSRCRSHQLDREKIMRPANYFEVCICIWCRVDREKNNKARKRRQTFAGLVFWV